MMRSMGTMRGGHAGPTAHATRVRAADLRIEVSPDGGWALVIDRVDGVRLVRLADGHAWPIDRDRILVWAGG